MSKEFNVVGLTIESIKNDDLKVLDKCLKIMPIEKLVDKSDNLLSTFLSLSAGYNRGDAAKMILERWHVTYPDNDKITMMTRLFLKISINIETLTFLANIHKDFTFLELMDELSEWDCSADVVTACGRADTIYGKQPLDVYKTVRSKAIEFKNYLVEEYMIDKIVEYSDYAKVPSYVKNYIGDYISEYKNRYPKEKELNELADKDSKREIKEYVYPSEEEAIKLLTEGLESFGISIVEIEEAKEVIRKELSNEERKKELLDPILKNESERELTSDRLLFWTFGPNNPLVNQNLNLNTPSAKYGGCRMFLCDLFDYDEENDYLADWFIGSCEQCLSKIKHRWHAVRQPRETGGWIGCFCSWECVDNFIVDLETAEGQLKPIVHDLISAFEKKTREIGIQERED